MPILSKHTNENMVHKFMPKQRSHSGTRDICRTGEQGRSTAALLKSQMEKNLERKSELCSALEDIADHLPYSVGPDHCRTLIKVLQPTLSRAHTLEEDQIFPLIVEHFPEIKDTVDRLRKEHIDDDGFASEIEECFLTMSEQPKGSNVDSLSYMLRGFFESLRRHIAFEREHILPLLDLIARKH